MPAFRPSVSEFIQSSQKLLKIRNLSEDEEDAVKEMLRQLSIQFPDEGDNAAD